MIYEEGEGGEQGEPTCAACGAEMGHVHCERCDGDGVTGHDCGEDSCPCVDPEDNLRCDVCDGEGGWWRCYVCSPLSTQEVTS